jgi:hypothetical protein
VIYYYCRKKSKKTRYRNSERVFLIVSTTAEKPVVVEFLNGFRQFCGQFTLMQVCINDNGPFVFGSGTIRKDGIPDSIFLRKEVKIMYQTFAHQINRAKTILDGLKTHAGEMAKYGITEELVTGLAALFEQANQLEKQRNDLKTSAREATVEQTQTMAQLNKQCSTVRKAVKTWMPKEQWHSFGFRAGEYASKPQTASSETPNA